MRRLSTTRARAAAPEIHADVICRSLPHPLASMSAMESTAARVRLSARETALEALRRRPGGMSPLNVGVALAGDDARQVRRDALIRSGNQVLSALARHGLVVRIQPRGLGWPIYKITDEGRAAIDAPSGGSMDRMRARR
jgi:hypothetical protein